MPFLRVWRRDEWPPRVRVASFGRILEGARLGADERSPLLKEWRKDRRVFMAYAAGVDVGSTQTKAVIIDEAGTIVGRALIDTGANVIAAAEDAFAQALTAG